jgi:hypothetical protein
MGLIRAVSVIERNTLQQFPRVGHFFVKVESDLFASGHESTLRSIADNFRPQFVAG